MIIQLNEIKIKADYLEENHKIIALEKHWENSYAGELTQKIFHALQLGM